MIQRFRICIPVYNNPGTIRGVVEECLSSTPYPVLAVDDGSDNPVSEILNGIAETLTSGRLEILRLKQNEGKGVALQAAFRDSASRGFTHLITLDGDGQHLPREIPKLVALSRQHPWDLVIGNRRLEQSTVPGVSRFGRKFSNFWVSFQTDAKVCDSQSGFRVYPVFQVQNMRFFTRRFDFEIEVLIRLLWKGAEAREAEIDVFYPEKEKRVSHFHKLWDNARISLLNTVLVILSLLKSHRSPLRQAAALGIGVWIGSTPFFGLHTFIAAAFAFALRLNFVFLWAGTQISIPPLAPLLAAGSIAIGKRIAPSGELPRQWLYGSLVLGAILGTGAGALSYLFAKRMSAMKNKGATWNGRSRGGKLGNGFLIGVLRFFGLKPAYACLYFIIPYFYLFAPKARRASQEYWLLMKPEAGFFRRQLLVLKHLLVFAKTLIDRAYQAQSDEPRFKIKPHGIENILEPVHAGRGLVLLSAHTGGWDLAASQLKGDGLTTSFHMIRFEAAGMTFDKARGGTDPEYLRRLEINAHAQPAFLIREILESGKPVGLMGDRPVGAQYELIPFLGKLAPFDVTPFRIAALCRAELLFTFGFKAEGSEYHFFATRSKKYAYVPGKDKAEQCREWAREFVSTLEDLLRRYPEQWFNFFPFWSSPPAPPEGWEQTRRPELSTGSGAISAGAATQSF